MIIWSSEARRLYEKIIDDLIENWSIEIVLDFEQRVNNLLNNLITNNLLCPETKYKKLHKCIVHENVSLIYKVRKKNIEIVSLVLNKSNHKFY